LGKRRRNMDGRTVGHKSRLRLKRVLSGRCQAYTGVMCSHDTKRCTRRGSTGGRNGRAVLLINVARRKGNRRGEWGEGSGRALRKGEQVGRRVGGT